MACVIHTAELLRSVEGMALVERVQGGGIRCLRASDGLMGTLTPTRPLPLVIAAVGLRLDPAPMRGWDSEAVLLVAENLQNPDNLGMVLRTADAAGVAAVVVSGETTDPLHRNCVRAARGAVGRIPIFTCDGLPAWLRGLGEGGVMSVASSAHAQQPLFEAGLHPPVAIVVGNEERGVSTEVLQACTHRLRIPMAPGQSSLNVAVAAGVLLYELRRPKPASTPSTEEVAPPKSSPARP